MKKTLGGDRLGSGKKMEVELHNYGRSTHDLSYIMRTTMSAGTLVPFMSEIGLPGDVFEIDLQCVMMTHPTVGPLFGSEKVQLDIFVCPIRLYQGQLHNNKLGIGLKMNTVKLPVFTWNTGSWEADTMETRDIDNAHTNPSSIFAYLGLRGMGQGNGEVGGNLRTFNATSWLAYWDTVKNYYTNKQEEIGAVIHTVPQPLLDNITDITLEGETIAESPATGMNVITMDARIVLTKTGDVLLEQVILQLADGAKLTLKEIGEVTLVTPTDIQIRSNNKYLYRGIVNWRYQNTTDTMTREIGVHTFPLENIDIMRERILAHAVNSSAFDVTSQNLEPWSLAFVTEGANGFRSILESQEGLAVKAYQSDMFNNWLSTEWIDGTNGINEITAIDTSGGTINVDTIVLARKVYDMLNRIAVSGGTYDDWLDAVYTNERWTRAESPIYMGGLIKEIEFQEVISSVGTSQQGGEPLGTLGGRGVMGKKHKGGHVTCKIDEPSYILGIVSITPRLDYSQGNAWDVNLKTMDDLHKPALDEIGFQDLITEQMAWWDTVQNEEGDWIQKSAGKQPAWLNYMTNVNRVRGNFAIKDNEMFMTFNRRYEAEVVGNRFTIGDLTTYIDPRKFNWIFADTALDSQNYWAQIGVDIKARRKMSARIMPNL